MRHTTFCTAKPLSVIWLIGITLLTAMAPATHAAFMPVANPVDEARKLKQEWRWNFAQDAVNPSTIAGNKWGRRVESMAGAQGKGPTLVYDVRHKDNPDGAMEINPNPPDQNGQPKFFSIVVEEIKRPGAGQMPQNASFVTSVGHPNLLGHADTQYLRLTVPNAGMVDVKGRVLRK